MRQVAAPAPTAEEQAAKAGKAAARRRGRGPYEAVDLEEPDWDELKS